MILVEKEALGGTCLNWGCVPTKSLLYNAEVIHLLARGRVLCFTFDDLEVNYAAAQKRSRQVVMRQTRRVAALMKTAGVMAMDNNNGFIKIVAEARSKKILGVHMVGGHVTELVAGPTGMIALEADAARFGAVVHPHPTLSEALVEAAHKLCGHAIHL